MNKKLDSKEKILQTASRLFQLKGYHATGINQIIKETGLPKGSIYHHFPNGKEELALEAVKYTSKYIEDKITSFLTKEPDVVEAIQAFIMDSANQFRKFFKFLFILFSTNNILTIIPITKPVIIVGPSPCPRKFIMYIAITDITIDNNRYNSKTSFYYQYNLKLFFYLFYSNIYTKF